MRFDPKDYVDVQERINQFWVDHPDGAINCDLLTDGAQFDAVVVKAFVYVHRDDMRASATGLASEERGADYKAGANLTSWHENCETSAIGRALANLAYAKSRKDRPSRQEMQKVERAQQTPRRENVTVQRDGIQQEYHEGDTGLMVPGAVQSTRTVNQIAGGGTIAPGVGMTDNQRKAIWAIATKERAMTDADVEQLSMQMFGVELKALDKQQASTLIETLKQEGDTTATHPKVQQAIDTREADWVAAMEGAATVGELKRIGLSIAEAKPANEQALRAVYQKQLDRLQERQLVTS